MYKPSSSKLPSQNQYQDQDPNAMDAIPLDDKYEPQHQYQEPSEEVESQLNIHSSPDQDDAKLENKRKPALPPRPTSKDGKDGGRVSKLTDKAKGYGKFVFEHMKKGEIPWTQWYCCNVVDGKECETTNNRLKSRACKKCKHEVCDNCVKATL